MWVAEIFFGRYFYSINREANYKTMLDVNLLNAGKFEMLSRMISHTQTRTELNPS